MVTLVMIVAGKQGGGPVAGYDVHGVARDVKIPPVVPPDVARGLLTMAKPDWPSAQIPSSTLPQNNTRLPSFNSKSFFMPHSNGQVFMAVVPPTASGPHPNGGPGDPPALADKKRHARFLPIQLARISPSFAGPPFVSTAAPP